MAEDGHARIERDLIADAVGDVEGTACALRNDDHIVREAVQTGIADLFDDLGVEALLASGTRTAVDGKVDMIAPG